MVTRPFVRDPKRQKNTLGKAVAGGYRGAVTRIVRGAAHFDHNVPLVGGAVIIGVNNTNGIIQPDPVLKAQPGAGKDRQHPALRHPGANAGGHQHRGVLREDYRSRHIKIIPGRPGGGALWQHDTVIDSLHILRLRERF